MVRFFFEFWKSGWNIFDLLVVLSALISLHTLSALRLLRAFRAVRLFKRLSTLRKLLDCIVNSFTSVTTAFSILLLLTGIYAIIGVGFWKELYSEEFGDFFSATLSLLQITTFDSWCSGIARKVIFSGGLVGTVYFVSYIFISSTIMMNIAIALLMESFMMWKDFFEDLENTEESSKEFEKSIDQKDEVLFQGKMGYISLMKKLVLFKGSSWNSSTRREWVAGISLKNDKNITTSVEALNLSSFMQLERHDESSSLSSASSEVWDETHFKKWCTDTGWDRNENSIDQLFLQFDMLELGHADNVLLEKIAHLDCELAKWMFNVEMVLCATHQSIRKLHRELNRRLTRDKVSRSPIFRECAPTCTRSSLIDPYSYSKMYQSCVPNGELTQKNNPIFSNNEVDQIMKDVHRISYIPTVDKVFTQLLGNV